MNKSSEKHDIPPMNDPVNPNHYNGTDCLDTMIKCFGYDEVALWCKITAFKYLYRCDHKNGDEDLKKAKWYLDKYLEMTMDPRFAKPGEKA